MVRLLYYIPTVYQSFTLENLDAPVKKQKKIWMLGDEATGGYLIRCMFWHVVVLKQSARSDN